jgi:hypothetical protein
MVVHPQRTGMRHSSCNCCHLLSEFIPHLLATWCGNRRAAIQGTAHDFAKTGRVEGPPRSFSTQFQSSFPGRCWPRCGSQQIVRERKAVCDVVHTRGRVCHTLHLFARAIRGGRGRPPPYEFWAVETQPRRGRRGPQTQSAFAFSTREGAGAHKHNLLLRSAHARAPGPQTQSAFAFSTREGAGGPQTQSAFAFSTREGAGATPCISLRAQFAAAEGGRRPMDFGQWKRSPGEGAGAHKHNLLLRSAHARWLRSRH